MTMFSLPCRAFPLSFDVKDTRLVLPYEQHTSSPVRLLAMQHMLVAAVEPATGHVSAGRSACAPTEDGVGLSGLCEGEPGWPRNGQVTTSLRQHSPSKTCRI